MIFEEFIRKFAEASNETAGEHFTPREVIQLIVHCLFAGDDEAASKAGVVRSMYDPTAGTGGTLSWGEVIARLINNTAVLRLYGQELNGSLLFLMHLISKMRPAAEGGGRVAIVLNGSPLFTGEAGSGESEIRRWIIENDMLEAIIALPNDLFYNTGIATYFWILDNDKKADRKGKVQLIDATRMYAKMKKSLGNKRVLMTDEQIAEIVGVYSTATASMTTI